MSFLDALIYGVRDVIDGSAVASIRRSRIRVVGATVTDNETDDCVDITPSGAVAAAQAGQFHTVRVKTTANISLSGAQTIDGVSVVAGDRVLVANQTTQADNGIYVAATGAWTRATDWPTGTSSVTSGAEIRVAQGTAGGGNNYYLSTTGAINVGVTSTAFATAGGSVTWADDLVGSSSTHQYVSGLTGASGKVTIRSTAASLEWANNTNAPSISQADNTTNSATAQALTIQAQNATGTTATGGALNLTSGTGTTAAGAVNLKTGGTSRLAIAAALATWSLSTISFAAAQTTPLLNQIDKTTNSATGETLTLQAQNATGTTATGGDLALTSGTGTSAAGNVLLKTGGTTRLTVAPTLVSTALSIQMLSVTLGASGPTITKGTTAAIAATTPPDGSIGLATDGTSASTGVYTRQGGTWYAVGSGGTSVTWAGDLAGSSSSSQIVVALTGASNAIPIAATGRALQWAAATTTPSLSQADLTTNSATGAALTIQAQNATGTTATGGALVLTSGTGTTVAGNVDIRTGGTSRALFAPTSVTLTLASILFANGQTPVIKENDNTTNSATAAAFTVQAANATGTSATGGALVLTSGTGTTAPGAVNIQTGGTTRVSVAAAETTLFFPTLSFDLGQSAPNIRQQTNVTNSATAENLSIQAQNASGTTSVGGSLILTSGTGTSTNGSLLLKTGGSTRITLTDTLISPNITLSWTNTSTPIIKQADLTTNSGTGAAFTIQAQNETGTTSTGGALVLTSGTGTSANGALTIQTGGTQVIKYTGATTLAAIYGPSATDGCETSTYTATTSATTANTTIATIPITASVCTQLLCTVVGRSTTNYTTLTISRSFYNNAGTVTADNAADVVTDVGHTATAGAAIALNYSISSANVLVRVTPWTATSTSWRVYVQAIRL